MKTLDGFYFLAFTENLWFRSGDWVIFIYFYLSLHKHLNANAHIASCS